MRLASMASLLAGARIWLSNGRAQPQDLCDSDALNRPGKSLNAFSLTDASTSEIDFVFLFFLASRYQPLVGFLQDTAP